MEFGNITLNEYTITQQFYSCDKCEIYFIGSMIALFFFGIIFTIVCWYYYESGNQNQYEASDEKFFMSLELILFWILFGIYIYPKIKESYYIDGAITINNISIIPYNSKYNISLYGTISDLNNIKYASILYYTTQSLFDPQYDYYMSLINATIVKNIKFAPWDINLMIESYNFNNTYYVIFICIAWCIRPFLKFISQISNHVKQKLNKLINYVNTRNNNLNTQNNDLNTHKIKKKLINSNKIITWKDFNFINKKHLSYNDKCIICDEQFDYITDCSHSYCCSCLQLLLDRSIYKCSMCNKMFNNFYVAHQIQII